MGFAGQEIEIPEDGVQGVSEILRKDYDTIPVFPRRAASGQTLQWLFEYALFVTRKAWPLLHYYPDKMSFDESFGQVYDKVNQRFADVVTNHV